MTAFWALLFFTSLGLMALHLLIVPALTIAAGFFFKAGERRPETPSEEALPRVTILVTCCNEGDLIRKKAKNLARLNYPADRLQIIFAADGPKDDPRMALGAFLSEERIRLIHFPENRGKIPVINDAASHCTGDILLFTDVDALLHPSSLKHLVQIFEDTQVGGGCGLHRLSTEGPDGLSEKSAGQRIYWSFDTLIKRAETRLGSISSCYGTIYAIRRSLFTRVPASVTDDAFQAMGTVRQGRRFIFVPEALAEIHPPSKSPEHELKRRRRIVLRSLRGLWLSRELLNPFRYGFYAFRLAAFKGLRRMNPLFMIGAFAGNWGLCPAHPVWIGLFLAQSGFYLTGLFGWAGRHTENRRSGPLKRISSVVLYYCVGNMGSLLGIVDFLKGKRMDRWET
jgi:cellulose synthase/poly-beta-1,6-N-acetylglucosamine synthase-like glycosyltransferase